MATNAFHCNRCGKYIRHIEVSYREASATRGDNVFDQLGAGICDFTGVAKLYNSITGCHYWKCCECGIILGRNSAGEVL